MNRGPIRTCLGCRQRRAKDELVRLARRPDSTVCVDGRGVQPGRGAYVCAAPECVERALKTGRLRHAFRAACRLDEGLEAIVLAEAAAGHDIGA